MGGRWALLLFAPWTLPAMAREASDPVTLAGCIAVSSLALFGLFRRVADRLPPCARWPWSIRWHAVHPADRAGGRRVRRRSAVGARLDRHHPPTRSRS